MNVGGRFRFERLEVWSKSLEFSALVYRLTKEFPVDERFGLTSQLRRAAVSIPSNIAEGSSRSSDTEFARFIEIAYGSLMECITQLYIAREQQYVSMEDFDATYASADELGRMLSTFRSRLKH